MLMYAIATERERWILLQNADVAVDVLIKFIEQIAKQFASLEFE